MSDNTNDTPASAASAAAGPGANGNWEREVLEKLVFATLQEQRAHRRWSVFFKVTSLLVVLFALWVFYDYNNTDDSETLGRHTALIDITGTIDADGSGSAGVVIPALDKAFSDSGSVAVVLHINSPGGSPVQAGMIVDEMQRLRKGYPDKPLYVVVDEMCASGGYYIAAAADKIFVNKASVVGSIGVLMDGFGFTGAMEKVGIERRLLTAGENKGFMDPFSPLSEKHKAYAQGMLNEIHQQFIDVVRAGRGKRLKETPEMFSGLVWTGEQSIALGLADGFGSLDSVARDVIKAEKIVDYSPKDNVFEQLSERLGTRFGAGIGRAVVDSAARSAVGVR